MSKQFISQHIKLTIYDDTKPGPPSCMLWIMHISHVKGRYSQENEICHRTVTTIQITRWCPHPTLVGGCVWHVHKFDKKIILKGPQQHWKAQRYWIAVGHSVCPTILYGLPTKKNMAYIVSHWGSSIALSESQKKEI